MFSKRSNEPELMDDLTLSSTELQRNLDELDAYNYYFGGKNVLISALNKIEKKYNREFKDKTIVIADLGCGSGELLRIIARWAAEKNLAVELIGIDASPFVVNYAIAKTTAYPNIKYQMLDIFSDEFKKLQFDIVTINSVTHHFSDAALVHLFKQLSSQTHFALLVNDLQRHWLSYYFVRGMTKIFNFSHFYKHDAPLSVLRAFSQQELIDLLHQANLGSYDIRWAWAFRWELIIWC